MARNSASVAAARETLGHVVTGRIAAPAELRRAARVFLDDRATALRAVSAREALAAAPLGELAPEFSRALVALARAGYIA